MHSISLDMETLTASSFATARQLYPDPSSLTPVRPRRPLRGLRVLLVSACAVMATACATLSAPSDETPPTRAELDAAASEAATAKAAAEAAEGALSEAQAATAAAQADAAQARADAEAAQQDAARARADVAAAQQDAAQAQADATAAQQDAAQARAAEAEAMAKVDAMMMAAHHPSAVMVSADMLDVSLLDFDEAQASLAGPDSIYISSIRYGGETYSALLKYQGGTTASVEGIFGHDGKLIPDSVNLGMTELTFLAPNRLVVSNVDVGGAGYSGELQYVGGNRLQVAGIRRATLPPAPATRIAALEAELAAAQAAADAAMAQAETAMAETETAMADAQTAQAAAQASAAEAAAAQAKVDAMMAADHQPSQVMVSAEMLDPSLANLDQVQVSLAGPDAIYLSNIMYGGVPYSALLRYSGGTTATVEAVYGPMGKLIPDSVGLAQTELDFMAPAALAVSNVEVGGVGYSGTLEYAGGDQLQVTNIRRVTLPPTAAERAAAAIAQAEADAAAAVSAARAEAEAAMADAQAAMADAEAAMADVQAAQAAAGASAAETAAAQARMDAMMAADHQPSQVMVSAEMLDPSLANLDQVQVSLAGPDSIYLSNIMYGGVPYSALLRYTGGTSATVEAVYGPMGKLIPDSVGLAQTELDFMAPATLAVSNVEVGGVGYSGRLEYAGGDQLRVTNIRRVTLPPTAADEARAENESLKTTIAEHLERIAALEAELADARAEASAARAEVSAAHAKAEASSAEVAAAQAKVDAMMAADHQPSQVMVFAEMLDPSRANLDQVRVSLAGPDSIYLSNIMYDGMPYSARLKYTGGTSATVEAVYGQMGKLIPDSVGLAQTTVEFVAPASLAVSNVEVGGVGYSGTLEYAGGDQLRVTNIRRVTLPPTESESAKAEAAAAVAKAQADAAAAVSMAQAEAETAMADAQSAMADAEAAMAAADAAAADAAAAQAKVDAMMAAGHQPSQVMVFAEMLDPSRANLDQVRVTLAGPDAIYLSNIMYDGMPYSALLRYTGGTSATVEAVYGQMGKLIPDSVGLAQTTVEFVAPASLAVSNVEVGGVGYSGTLEYAGGDQLRVTNIRRVALPPSAAEAARAEADAAVAKAQADAAAAVSMAQAEAEAAMADAEAAMADAQAAQAAAAASAAEAAAAQAKVDAMMAAGHQPSQVMVFAEMLDASRANLDQVRVTLAGPDAIYLSNIMYDGMPYSALLRYTGGTSATVEAVYGQMGKLIPDSVGLAQTTVEFVAPAALAVSNVEVGGVGYSGTLEYAGGDQLRVTDIRRVTLPPTAAETAQAEAAAAIAKAQADAAAAVSAAQAKAEAAMADAQSAMADAEAAAADVKVAKASSQASAAEAKAAQAQVDAMMAADHQPSQVMVFAEMLDANRANLDQVRVTLAGPDAIYLSNIMYDGMPYSALLKYTGGTSATVEAVYGQMGKLIPDSVGLAQTTVEFVAPASLAVSNVEVGGVGYSGTLEYAGGDQLRVTNIRRVTLPPTAAQTARAEAAAALERAQAAEAEAAAARAEADAALERAMAAEAAAAMTMDEADAAMAEADEGIPLVGLNLGLLDLESARLNIAGPNSIYISGVQYAGRDVSVRVSYEQGGMGKVEALFDSADDMFTDAVTMDAAEIEVVGDALVLSNVGIQGLAHTLTLTFDAEGGIDDVAVRNNGWAVRTVAELQRDKLITGGTYLVNGFTDGQALANEGAWSESGATVTQTDSGASHAKYTIPAAQSGSEMLFGVTASAPSGSDKVGFGLHLLASDTPDTANTWNYGRSYLIWATRDPFYDTDATHLQFYESSDNNTLAWLASRRIEQSLNSPLTLEALYQSDGTVTLLVGGEEQLRLNVGAAITAGDRVALRSLGGPVEFTQVYVTAR